MSTSAESSPKLHPGAVLGVLALAVFLGVIGLGVMGACSCSQAIESATKPVGSKGNVTYAQFEKLQTGMSYAQACKVLGGPGRETSRVEILNTTAVMYAWDGDGGFGANMNATFQNDQLVSKAQFGLR